MSVTKTGKKKLFRMTTKRKIILEGIITTINGKADHVGEDGFARLLVLNGTHLSEEERNCRLQELDKEYQELSLLHDVLEVVINHEDDVFLNIHMKEQRDWRNEWDVPLNVFNDSIDKVIEILKWYQQQRAVQVTEDYHRSYDKKIEFLLELKEFRNQA